MQPIVAIFILVFHCSLCKQTQAAAVINQHEQHRFNSSCQDINCPTNYAPICVKLKYPAKKENKTIYIVMINKCEMKYVNCYKGMQAAETPMKNCDHKKVHGKRRLKRSLPIEAEKSKRKERDLLNFGANKSKSGKMFRVPMLIENNRMYDKGYLSRLSNAESDGPINIPSDKSESDVKQMLNKPTFENNVNLELGGSDDFRSESPVSEREKSESKYSGKKPMFETEDSEQKSEPAPQIPLDNKSGTEKDVSPKSLKLAGALNNNDDDSQYVDHSTTVNKLNDEGPQIYESEDIDSKQHVQVLEGEERQSGRDESVGANDNVEDDGAIDSEVDEYGVDVKVDKEQYNEECPTACPMRDVMLCARCVHGVYRTFPSVCHMRVFNCKQPEEKLELVSRKPCVLSAPYLNDVAEPKGRVSEPGDEDPVLRYYRCKQKLAKLGKELTDPDCLSLKLKAEVTELSATEE